MFEALNLRVKLQCKVAIPNALQRYAYILPYSIIRKLNTLLYIALNFHPTAEIRKTAVLVLIPVHS
jgi:hypothetical protein